ncbi:MAG: hypothetical protein H5T69_00400 [Chloroflexi bacterium]|nr:hypothetical protein [Chloroflexota bacterium]
MGHELDSMTPSEQQLLSLQRRVGNRAVQKYVLSHRPGVYPAIQRGYLGLRQGDWGDQTAARQAYRERLGAMAGQVVQNADEEGASSLYVHYNVPLIPQTSNMSCWAASAAMLVSWRDSISISDQIIASGIGYWSEYLHGLDPEDIFVFASWGLVEEEPQTFTIQAFADLLDQYGPLWTAGDTGAGAHVRVVTGISGDGTPDGTFLSINDPAPVGRGSEVIESYAQFLGIQERLATQELPRYSRPLYVAHCR